MKFADLQIHNQLEEMHLEIQIFRNDHGKEGSQYVWCIRSKGPGHSKDPCPLFSDYMQAGDSSSLRPTKMVGPSSLMLWCADCWVVGRHDTDHWPRLGAYVPEIKQHWCRFFSSVGHDEQNCRTLDLMVDRGNLYRVKIDPSSPLSLSRLEGSLM